MLMLRLFRNASAMSLYCQSTLIEQCIIPLPKFLAVRNCTTKRTPFARPACFRHGPLKGLLHPDWSRIATSLRVRSDLSALHSSRLALIAFSHQESTDPADQPGVQPLFRLISRLAKWLAGFAIIALLALVALPTILSTGRGLRAGTALASRFTPGIIHIDQADMGWTKPSIKLSGLSLKSPAILGGETLALVESISCNARLWDIVRGRGFDVFATNSWIDCSLAASGQLKWAQLFDYESGRATKSSTSQVLAHMETSASQAAESFPLVAETAEVPFTAEGRVLAGSLYVAEGTLKVPAQVREVIGRDLHLTAVVGAENVIDSSEELALDTAWVTSESPSHSLNSQADMLDQHIAQLSSSGTPGSGTSMEASAGSGRKVAGLAHLEPTIITVRSEHLDLEASGWRRADGKLLLRRPAHAKLQFTPALAKFGLARISPLLSGILAVEEGTVGITLAPTGGWAIPAEGYRMRIAPLRVAVNRQNLLAKAIEFLRLKEGGEIAKKSLLQGATSAIHVECTEQGAITSKRLDLLISPGGKSKGVHLCTWGKIDPVTGSMDIALGVPAGTLSMVGLKRLGQDDMLVLPVRGSTTKPRVDWVEAYRRLAALAANHQNAEPNSLRGKILQGVVQGLDLRANAPGLGQAWKVPAPVEGLPWAEDSRMLQREVKVDSTTVADTGTAD